MTTPDQLPPSSDERLMGALAHFFGPLVALVVWITQKDKSRFVKFQALQALAFDVVLLLVMGVVSLCLFGLMFLGIFGTMFGTFNELSSTPQDIVPFFFMLPFMFPFLTFVCILPLSLLITAVRLIASISIVNGRNYQYPLLGKWVENFLKE
jgi:uncharacterized Tic20 family protein